MHKIVSAVGACNKFFGNSMTVCASGRTNIQHIVSVLSEINVCDSHPCMNGAICNDEFNAFSCTCMAGYDGDICQVGMFLLLH